LSEEEHPTDVQVTTDRRRRGRVHTTNPYLIGLFRTRGSSAGVSQLASPALVETDEQDQLAATKGIILSVIIGLVLWIAFGFGVWYFLW
jgi:hypothetical protein